jgi:hypothetical protein
MFSLESSADRLRLTWDGRHILDYRLEPEGGVPFWHPLRMPGSPALTMDRPADHVHHRGMWLAWKKVNGVNFWEQPASGPETPGYGHILHRRVLSHSIGAEQARFSTASAWIDWRGRQILTDVRDTTVDAPREGYLAMDIALQLTATEQKVTLDLRRGEPGRGGLFYSGLAIRFANGMSPGRLVDAEGKTEAEEIFGSRSAWCGFAGRHSEDGQVYGIAVIDHPDNPCHPTSWWVRNAKNYALLHPSPTYDESIEVTPGRSLTFRYRIVLHLGYTDPGVIDRLRW